MKTKMICFIAFISYTFYLTAGDIYVSPYGNDKAAGTRQSPLQTLEQAIKQAREWRRLQSPETTGGINILLEEGIYPQYKSLFIRPEDSGTTDSPTRITTVPNAHVVLSGGVPVTGWEQGCEDTRIPKTLRNKIMGSGSAPYGKQDIGNPTNVGQRSKSTAGRTVSRRSNGTHD